MESLRPFPPSQRHLSCRVLTLRRFGLNMGLKDESAGFWKIIRSSWLVHRKTITPAPAESPGSTSWTRVSGSTMNRCCCHCVGLRAEDDERANVIGAQCMLRWGSVLSGCRHGMSALFEVLGRPRPSVFSPSGSVSHPHDFPWREVVGENVWGSHHQPPELLVVWVPSGVEF